MKKSELKDIIKEEINNIFEENKTFEMDIKNLDKLNGEEFYDPIVYTKISDNLYRCEMAETIKFSIKKDDATSMIFIVPLDSDSLEYFTNFWDLINEHGGTKFIVYKSNKMISKSVKNFVKYLLQGESYQGI